MGIPLTKTALKGIQRQQDYLGWKNFTSQWQNVLGLGLVVIFIIIALGANFLAPNREIYYLPDDIIWQDDPLNIKPHPPGESTLLGTVPIRGMHTQLDVYTVLIHGTRSALVFGLITGLSTAFLGVLIGSISGWLGGWKSQLLMRLTDSMLTFPVVIGVVFIQQLFMVMVGGMFLLGASNRPYDYALAGVLKMIDPVLLAIILFSWMPYARLTNTMILQVKRMDYVNAAIALGADSTRIMNRHLIPNSISPAVVLLARDIGGFVTLQATFTFIGLSSRSEWGELLALARDWIVGPGGNLLTRWWVFLPVTLALILFGIGWNLLGDGLNDWLNPRTRTQKMPDL